MCIGDPECSGIASIARTDEGALVWYCKTCEGEYEIDVDLLSRFIDYYERIASWLSDLKG